MAPGKGFGGDVRQGVSYKQSLAKVDPPTIIADNWRGGFKQLGSRRELTATQIRESTMDVAVVEENMKKFEKCWVGKLWDQNDVDSIQFKILMEGFQMISIVYLGLDMVLLSSVEEDGVKNAVTSNKDWWSRCFIEIFLWTLVVWPRGRRVWIRIFGAPLHVWGEDCFGKVVCGFGKLIKLDEPTKSLECLEYARAQVAINCWDTIDKVLDIRVGQDLLVLKLIEERWTGEQGVSNVDTVGLLGNGAKQLFPDTPTPVIVGVSLREGEEIVVQQNKAPLVKDGPTIAMEKAMVVLPDNAFDLLEVGPGGSTKTVGAADVVGSREGEKSHQLLGFGVEVISMGGTDFCRGRMKDRVGLNKVGLNGVLNLKPIRGVGPGGRVDKLIKGSCSLWAQSTNKFGPLNLVVQQEEENVRRACDIEVVSLERFEKQKKALSLLCGPDSLGPGGGASSKTKGSKKQNKKNLLTNSIKQGGLQGVYVLRLLFKTHEEARREMVIGRSWLQILLQKLRTQSKSRPIQRSKAMGRVITVSLMAIWCVTRIKTQ
ncbi:unnamed protein product [Trifolium pratense]|uniref:Uncharacterized protein n=1 Tax=Trifolium pratense TaxID=57577 RepID=A0ACB0I7R8_TRIPR|nr:unnamed protein product [Trifolium pratense]